MKATLLQPTAEISLKKYLGEALIPQRWYEYVFLGLIVLTACNFWFIQLLWNYPGVPLSFMASTGRWDATYWPIISALSQFQFGESGVIEFLGQGLQSFPFASIFPHALGLRLLGTPGLMLVDILIALCNYVVLVMLFRILGISNVLSASASCLLASGGLWYLTALTSTIWQMLPKPLLVLRLSLLPLVCILVFRVLRRKAKLPPWLVQLGLIFALILIVLFIGSNGFRLLVHWYRIPRPFITNMYFWFCLCLIFTILARNQTARNSKDRSTLALWGLLGISFAALLQGEIYQALTTLLMIGFFMLYLLLRNIRRFPTDWKYQLKAFFVFFLTVGVCNSPFMVQRLFEHPDYMRRHGILPLARGNFLLFQGYWDYLTFLIPFAIGMFICEVLRQNDDEKKQAPHWQQLVLLCVCCFAAYIAMPVSIVLSGKIIFPSHFVEQFQRIVALVVTVFGLYVFSLLPRFFSIFSDKSNHLFYQAAVVKTRFPFRTLLIVGVIGLSVFPTLEKSWRAYNAYYAAAHTGETDLQGLLKTLSNLKQAGPKVIGTFDNDIYRWWVAFEKGYSFLPDAAYTPLPDSVIEERLQIFCKLLGMDSQEYKTLLGNAAIPYNISYAWLSCCKYVATPLYTFSALTDYDPEIQKKIQAASPFYYDAGPFYIPNSEQARFLRQYEALKELANDLKLDIIVLGNDEVFRKFSPSPGIFDLTYANATYRVYTRKANAKLNFSRSQ